MLIVGADLKTSTFAATFTQLRSISKKSFGWAKMPRSTLLKLFCLTRIVLSNLNGSPIPQWTTKEPLRGAHARGHGPWSRVHGRHDAWTESVSLHRPLFFSSRSSVSSPSLARLPDASNASNVAANVAVA